MTTRSALKIIRKENVKLTHEVAFTLGKVSFSATFKNPVSFDSSIVEPQF